MNGNMTDPRPPQGTAGARGSSVRFRLTLPKTRIGAGPFSFDPIAHFMGAPIGHFLQPLLVGEVEQRPSSNGVASEVYPLALPDGEGLTVPLGQFGEVGIRADGELLVLTVPMAVSSWVLARLGDGLVHASYDGLNRAGTARVADLWIRLRPGKRASVPLGMLGELGIEAG